VIARLPERGDHETTTFPDLAREGRLRAFRHEGLWLTVNTPKDLRRAQDYIESHPGLLEVAVHGRTVKAGTASGRRRKRTP
jgi:NDP-sugar pyrophosphorylase family protein